MSKDKQVIEFMKLNTGKEVTFFLHVPNMPVYLIAKPTGRIETFNGESPSKIRSDILRAWAQVNIRPVYTSWVPIGPGKFWFSEKFNLLVTFVQGFWRERLDLGDGLDAHYENAWYCVLSKSMDQLAEEDETREDYVFDYGLNGRTFTDDFENFLVSGLTEYGFRGDTPPASYSPTGQMFCRYSANIWGKRLVVKNMWARDV